jgi:IS1 family transposase
MVCPRCGAKQIIRNGTIHNGKQKYECRICNRQFVENPRNRTIPHEIYELIDRLLLEKIPLAGICRVAGISKPWLQRYVNDKYDSIPEQADVLGKPKGRLTIECDEMWSFVGSKKNKVWIWLAIDIGTKEIVGCHVGSRDRQGARGLWESLPPLYRQCAVCYTDFWSAYEEILPSKRHRPTDKKSGKTCHIERFNCTMRQRVSRLVRKTLSFSKKIGNHIGAIWNFIHHYNNSLPICSEKTTTIDFQKRNFTRRQGGDNTKRLSPTDNTVRLFFWKSILPFGFTS